MNPSVGDLVIVGVQRWRIGRFLISAPEWTLLRRRFSGEGLLIRSSTLSWDEEVGVWRAPRYHREGY